MSRSPLSVLLVLVVLLAGCNGLTDSRGSDPTRVTPADVPEDTPTPTPTGKLAPGVFQTGIIDVETLVTAHHRQLNTTSFTTRTNYSIYNSNGTLLRGVVVTVRVTTGPPFRMTRTVRFRSGPERRQNGSDRARTDTWVGPQRAIGRTSYVNGTTHYRTFSNSMSYSLTRRQTGIYRLNSTLSTVSSPVTSRVTDRQQRNGTTYYRIEAGVNPDSFYVNSDEGVERASQWLLVDERGVVHEQHITARIDSPNQTTRTMEAHITYTNVGETTVERPEWVDEAVQTVETVNRSNATHTVADD